MAKKLWAASQTSSALDPRVEAFCFTRDVELDAHLVRYDVIGSLAQAHMLESIGVLNNDERQELCQKLVEQLKTYEAGEWTIEVADEDVHTAIEGRLGSVGEKLHTARSRNDQVLTDMRLYSKDQILTIIDATLELASHLSTVANTFKDIPMPGYTHLQRAMPMSFGMWMGNFAEAFVDVVRELGLAYDLMDQSPLGSGAGYGVSLKIDRELSAKLMGFQRVQRNSLYCQNSRGHFEAVMLSAFTSIMSVASRLSSDVCLFCSEEFKFLKLPDAFFTGSSIMPQKKNPDLFELIRAKVMTLSSLEQRVRGVTHGITSGYSKDLQEVKEPVMEAVEQVTNTLNVLNAVMPDMKPNIEKLKDSMSPELFAAHRAYEMVREGTPFRQAYRKVKEELHLLDQVDTTKAVAEMNHTGATGNLKLEELDNEIAESKAKWQQTRQELNAAWDHLLKA
jgi:argininosuccinate lyase